MMKALITGGAGFIGSHLAESLLAENVKVTVVDSLSTGRLENIKIFCKNSKFEFHKGDVRDKALIEGLVEKNDVIYHLAAAVGVQLIADDPVHTIETNITGTEVVLEKANKFNRKILLASTSEVYGKNENVPFCEEDDIVLGSTGLSRWSYACSKAIDEFLGLAFCRQYGLEVVIGRFFNTIGPRQTGQYGMVVPRFVQSSLKNEPVLIYGTGQQSRCFCFIEDVVEALTSLMDCEQAVGKVFNIGSDEEITIEALADKIIEISGSKSEKKFISYQEAYGQPIEDMMRRVPSLKHINSVIGWKPKTNLIKALEVIIKHLRIAKG
jgi:UDP-glucose 4-epimerase